MNGFALASLATLLVSSISTVDAATPREGTVFDATVCITGIRPDGSKLESSGVVVRPGNRVLTVAHGLRGASEVRVRLRDGRTFPGQLVRFAAADVDMAVLEVGDLHLAAADLAPSAKLTVGDVVRAVGCPLGRDFTLTVGQVRAFRASEGVPLVQTDADVQPGSSGGPVFDERGRVVGIVKARAENTRHTNFFLPSDLADGFLQSLVSEQRGIDVFNRAVAERDAGRKIDLYREALEMLPSSPEPRYNLAVALERAGQTEQAIAQYREVVRRNPDYVPATLNLGAWLYEQGRYDEAIGVYQALLRHAPDAARARNNLAETYRKSGRIEQARLEFQRLAEEAPDYAQAQYGLGLLYEEDLDDPRRATPHYQRYLALVPDGPDSAEVQGRLRRTAQARSR